MFTDFLLTLPIIVGQFFRFAFLVVVIGSMAFFFGQLLPRSSFDYTRFPFVSYAWEDGGKIYTKVKIPRWKDKLPDMSQYVKSAFRKKITVFRNVDYLETLVLETCVAEFVHFILILISPIFLLYMDSPGNWIWMGIDILGNLPFILIQRYNRPRLLLLMEKQERIAARHNKNDREV